MSAECNFYTLILLKSENRNEKNEQVRLDNLSNKLFLIDCAKYLCH